MRNCIVAGERNEDILYREHKQKDGQQEQNLSHVRETAGKGNPQVIHLKYKRDKPRVKTIRFPGGPLITQQKRTHPRVPIETQDASGPERSEQGS